MSSNPYPPAEALRLAALQRTRMVGTPAEERFDKITRMARRFFNVSISMVSFLDETNAWIKSVQGDIPFEFTQAPRNESYCRFTIMNPDPCYIPDALLDPRVNRSIWAYDMRFYAGVPLKFEGHNVGSLCIIDGKPRTMTDDQLALLRELGDMVEVELRNVRLTENQMQLARENEDLMKRTLLDGLTRGWNRTAIFEIAEKEFKASVHTGLPLSILMLDIDYFKNVNDRHGHSGGDQVLVEFASRVRASARATDSVGRYGGEEFMVVMPLCDKDEVHSAGERMRLAVTAEPINVGKQQLRITTSVGGSSFCPNVPDVQTLIRRADLALYRAKQSGRNRTELDFASSPSTRPEVSNNDGFGGHHEE